MPNSRDDLRKHWAHLIRHALPQAARGRPDWPIRLDHCFARVILDAVYERPWREAIPAPAWRNMDDAALRRAVGLAEAILSGEADLHAMNARSLALRGKPQKRRQMATTGPRSSGEFRPS